MTAKEKMTAPIASVGADVEQPLSNKLTNQSIADLPGKGNLQATNNVENTAKSVNKKNPDDLETVSMMELYDTGTSASDCPPSTDCTIYPAMFSRPSSYHPEHLLNIPVMPWNNHTSPHHPPEPVACHPSPE